MIPAFLEAHGDIIGLVLLVGLFVSFAMERLPPVVLAVAGGVSMLALGYLKPDEMGRIFANPAPITIAAMFIISGALMRTGVLEAVSSWVVRRSRRFPRLALGEIGLGTIGASALVNNTPIVIVMIPIVKKLAKQLKVGATRLLIPLSFISIMGGTLTLIGTSTNLLVDGVAQSQGEPAFSVFEITEVGLWTALVGTVFLLVVGPFLLPDRGATALEQEAESNLYLSQLQLEPDSPLVGQKLKATALFKREGVRINALIRGSRSWRKDVGDHILKAGDLLVVAASPEELASLAEAEDFRVGLVGVGGGITMSGPNRADDASLVEAVVGPSHPIIGRRLADIPFLSRLKLRVLGLSRPRHLPGPDLAEARVRAGDRLLIAAGHNAALALQANANFAQVANAPTRSFKRHKAPIVVLTLVAIVALAAIFGLPIEALSLGGVAVVLLTRCIEPEEAWGAIDGNTLVLIYGMLAFGFGLLNAGTLDMIVGWAEPWLRLATPFMILVGVYALTSILTETVTNNAVAVIMTPLVLALADVVDVSSRQMLVAIMFGASASFATPIGYQTNTLVYGAANYRFTDFLKIGVPMNIVVGLAACIAIDRLI